MCWIISFIESLSPPGVSMVISTSAACRCAAFASPSSIYVARIGSTSPLSFSSTTAALERTPNINATHTTPKTVANVPTRPNFSIQRIKNPFERSLRAPFRRSLHRLSVLQMFQQLLGFRIVGCELQRVLHFRARQRRLFLLQVNARQRSAHHCRIPRLQRQLQLLNRLVQPALAARNLT